ncbi:MAG: AbrB family transcriptional regulator [Zetaproteobacteria bacterium CG12_big_fil_rev_8_21_14_0_65_54_13]|nr:MAG: AbrB family transcriptional regulator [Zetaproteobacteria bacterium CG23_combo_of_CG06-09_8_20_14_all_54_7]PIW47754.1 MAG: AbrB family transcriptional regulator [Zetaproteobacteria bacterium CG12_big_fil_rev_8_21_14_0_65_54_13]PIX54489.1 MAG: AbrB family transcriptional regulator [Zetaproteobacteria bacterium CG_4_10_14_3_um_filter_54_28]PJA26980.1 MAG: AbrB family transcriptional regulator [Zetaproteobacteria bacterium CG_4_9_14_3_um_filter_54_145]
MPLATLTSKGQVTIPSSVRKKLHLHAGDKIDFSMISDTEALLRPVIKDVDAVFGCLKQASNGIKATVTEMNAAIEEKMRQDFK